MKKKMSVGKNIGIALSVILTVFWLFPYIYVVCCSFKKGSEVIAVPPKFFPKVFSVENFQGLFERGAVFCKQSVGGADQYGYCADLRIPCGLCDPEIRGEIIRISGGAGTLFENDTYL